MAATTKCLIYNDTGGKVTFVKNHDYQGIISPDSSYPTEIANGQYASFLYAGSSGAVVYRGKNKVGLGRDWCLAWMTNHAYAEVHETDYYYDADWDDIKKKMESSGLEHVDTNGGCESKAATLSGTIVHFSGIMALQGAA